MGSVALSRSLLAVAIGVYCICAMAWASTV